MAIYPKTPAALIKRKIKTPKITFVPLPLFFDLITTDGSLEEVVLIIGSSAVKEGGDTGGGGVGTVTGSVLFSACQKGSGGVVVELAGSSITYIIQIFFNNYQAVTNL